MQHNCCTFSLNLISMCSVHLNVCGILVYLINLFWDDINYCCCNNVNWVPACFASGWIKSVNVEIKVK